MVEPLAERGISSVTVPLPSCGETGGELGDLYADAMACSQAVADVDGPVILCGHSYGGVVITEARVDDRVTKLLYVTSVMPGAGQSQAEIIGDAPAPWMAPSDDGTVGVDISRAADLTISAPSKRTTALIGAARNLGPVLRREAVGKYGIGGNLAGAAFPRSREITADRLAQAVFAIQWLWSFSRLCVAVTNRHSDCAAALPLRMNRSMCRLYLICPNTGSIVIFRCA
jgi:pimeloyl-ACP methyl ester carboxylesterase